MHPHIYVPKHKDKEIVVPITATRSGVGGEFRLVLRDCMGGIDYDSGWFGNLVCDQGLGLMTTANGWSSRMYIGSGSTAPANNNTQMETLLAIGTTQQGPTVGVNGVAPNWECSSMNTNRFAAGVGTGTVREVGLGSNDSSVGGLVARQLVSPSIVKGATQVLDVSYRFKIWPVLSTLAGTVTIDGSVYDTLVKGCYYDYPAPAGRCFSQFGPMGLLEPFAWGTADGNLAALDADFPLGSVNFGAESITWLSGGQSGGVGYREFDVKFGLNNANLVGGSRCCWAMTKTYHRIQCQFNKQSDSSKVLKDATKEWTPRFRIEWVRHP